MLTLQNADIDVTIAPGLGGGVDAFRWRGLDIFHRRPGAAGPLALGCFALSPFSGRIAQGRFTAPGGAISLKRNHPSDPDHPHALHGFDWLALLEVVEVSPVRAVLRRRHGEDEWPWPYETQQIFTLTKDGYQQDLSIANLGAAAMPAGLGLHPYFPRASARLSLDVAGGWETTQDLIPAQWRALNRAPEWLGGDAIDHCYSGRRGPIVIDWPGRRLTIEPDPAFSFAIVFTPPGEDYFCVEPVSHMPDAVNRAEPSGVTGLRWLNPGERWTTRTTFAVNDANG